MGLICVFQPAFRALRHKSFTYIQLGQVRPLSSKSLPIIRAFLRFLDDSPLFENEKPYHFSGLLDPTDEARRTNLALRPHDIAMHNLRDSSMKAELGVHGFQFEKFKSDFTGNLHEEEETLYQYMNETVAFVKKTLNAHVVLCYDYRV